MHVPLDRQSPIPLVQQLTDHLQAWIEQQRLRPGARLPSIRTLASTQAISASCVIEAYDRLVASGWLEARHGTGFFVAERKPGLAVDDQPVWGEAGDGSWRQFREGHDEVLKLGCGWLPTAWRAEAELAQAIRQVSRGNPQDLFDYCPPMGLAQLRLQLHKRLARLDIAAGPERILTTQGASHGLDLLVRTLLCPGDTVLVENPGYYNLYNLLRQHQVRMLPVPRTVAGPDVAVLEQLLAEHRPRCLFINSLYQNPTGTSLTPKVAYRLLELAREHDVRIIEDDIYADFQEGPATRLATLDSEQRVIYMASFSKTLSSSLRVGYLVADAPLLARLAELKMVSGIGTSRFAEQVVGQMLANGSYRKSTQRLRVRLGQHMAKLLGQLEQYGWQVFCEPYGGMFVWARVPGRDFASLERLATQHAVLLTPGSAFDYQGCGSDWLRINVAYGQDSRAQAFLLHAGRPSAS
ncbi:PLP-dependent aminotransferase family protein [Pseudomonas putida]|uniref:aminotransferase-like domain-containing protein n=1 Tax=Pseudomonas putida TaxID=303 RepID=UPI000DB13E61|nr:PLP-dependent aminotransferase family protein [Pseudomonas putida]MBI6941515.1 PLP-dependent aminotransferase family protein [Pseudomonas putida]MBI6957709.1 PLP-dependent aminotransferase family protein [Pseudomonas putida]MCZ9636500.1 PLP-dependent aminotransferase family protein [Pseudomonas putida]PZQ39424.1 MAG: GntR family transcriptional regulator [Pseudomonas putida]